MGVNHGIISIAVMSPLKTVNMHTDRFMWLCEKCKELFANLFQKNQNQNPSPDYVNKTTAEMLCNSFSSEINKMKDHMKEMESQLSLKFDSLKKNLDTTNECLKTSSITSP